MTQHVIVNAAEQHTATIIFLHGVGKTGEKLAPSIAAIKPPNAKLICPTAQTIPVTLRGGVLMTSWFELYGLLDVEPEDEAGIAKARDIVHELIDAEVRAGIPSTRIVLGGFSQGGALALYSGVTYSKPLAGIVPLSCWLPLPDKMQWSGANLVNLHTPVLHCHGDSDQKLPLRLAQKANDVLGKHMSKYHLRIYPGLDHSICSEEMSLIETFLKEKLA